MRNLRIGLVLASLLVFSSSVTALEANIQPSNPDDITLNGSNNHKVYKEFDSTASTGSISTYTWDLVGESSSDTGPKANFSFSRDSSGSNTIRLTVSNKTSSDVAEVTQILHDAPEATISANTTSIEEGEKVSFSSSITNSFDTPLSYDWRINGNSNGTGSSFTKKFDSSGDYDVKLNVSDTAGNFDLSSKVTVSVSNSSSTDNDNTDDEDESSSDGGGGGGAGLDISELPDSDSAFFLNIQPGNPVETTVEKSEKFGVNKIEVSVNNEVSGVIVKAVEQNGKPSDIDSEPNGMAYRYMNITAEDLSDDDIDQAKIRFEVNNSWINDNSISVSSINLSRYKDGDWQTLETRMVNQGNSKTMFEAETPGFSYFAISGEEESDPVKDSSQDNQGSEEEQEAQITSDSNQEPDQNNQSSEEGDTENQGILPPELFYVFLVLILTGLLAGGGFYYYEELYDSGAASEKERLAEEMQDVKQKLEKASEKNYDSEELRDELNKVEQEVESEEYKEAEQRIQSINEKLDEKLL